MSAVIEKFIAELRALPGGADIADDMAHAFDELDVEAGDNPNAATLYEASKWILSHGPSRDEQLRQIQRLNHHFEHDKSPIPSLRTFCGW